LATVAATTLPLTTTVTKGTTTTGINFKVNLRVKAIVMVPSKVMIVPIVSKHPRRRLMHVCNARKLPLSSLLRYYELAAM